MKNQKNNEARTLSVITPEDKAIIKAIGAGDAATVAGFNIAKLARYDSGNEAVNGYSANIVHALAVVAQTGDASYREVARNLARIAGEVELKDYFSKAGIDNSIGYKLARAGAVYIDENAPDALRAFGWSKLDALNSLLSTDEGKAAVYAACAEGKITSETTQKKLREIADELKVALAYAGTSKPAGGEDKPAEDVPAEGEDKPAEGNSKPAQGKREVAYVARVANAPIYCETTNADGNQTALARSATLSEWTSFFAGKAESDKTVYRIKAGDEDRKAGIVARYVVVNGERAAVVTLRAATAAALDNPARDAYRKLTAAGKTAEDARAVVALMFGDDWDKLDEVTRFPW